VRFPEQTAGVALACQCVGGSRASQPDTSPVPHPGRDAFGGSSLAISGILVDAETDAEAHAETDAKPDP
jgi:hypothetical protein